MEREIGEIKMLSVREYWPNEQQDFTPWLAEEENIAKLGAAIGLELEVENMEVAVGPYYADILARDSGSRQYVVIENQFGKTNHDHLGKLITYGSTLDASAVVWISEEFSGEHQKALAWLNDLTTDEIAFYGVVVELIQIDDSRAAVQFNVVSRPTDIVRQAAIAKAREPLTETKKLQLEFWTEFRNRLLEARVVPSVQAAQPQSWYSVALGRSGIHISNITNTFENHIGIRVYISNKVAALALPQLEKQQEEIEAELGKTLQWNPNPDNRDKIIALHRPADLRKRDKWPEYCEWLVDMNRRFREVFMPRVRKLNLNMDQPDQAEAES